MLLYWILFCKIKQTLKQVPKFYFWYKKTFCEFKLIYICEDLLFSEFQDIGKQAVTISYLGNNAGFMLQEFLTPIR